MKVVYFLVMLVSFIGITSCEDKDPDNLSEPVGWFMAGSRPQNYKIGVDNQNSQQGQKSGYIESVADTSSGFGTIMQFCSDKKFKGERVRMTGYIGSVGSDTTLTAMWIRVDDFGNGVTADFDNMNDRPNMGTNNWTKCVIVFDVLESTSVIYYGLILDGLGKAWIDNISFETVSSSTLKTAYYLNLPFPDEYQIPSDLPEEPVNLSFEE